MRFILVGWIVVAVVQVVVLLLRARKDIRSFLEGLGFASLVQAPVAGILGFVMWSHAYAKVDWTDFRNSFMGGPEEAFTGQSVTLSGIAFAEFGLLLLLISAVCFGLVYIGAGNNPLAQPGAGRTTARNPQA